MAMDLVETHRLKEIENVLEKYAHYIVEQGRNEEAIQLYRKANLCLQSANLLFEVV